MSKKASNARKSKPMNATLPKLPLQAGPSVSYCNFTVHAQRSEAEIQALTACITTLQSAIDAVRVVATQIASGPRMGPMVNIEPQER